MEKIKIGEIVSQVGLKGDVKVYNYAAYKERYEELPSVYVEEELHRIEKVRYQKNMVVLKLSGIDTREQAEAQKGKGIYITDADLPELPEDVYYIKDLLGCDILTEDGEILGQLEDVSQNGGQDLYLVKSKAGKEIMIPAVKEFILDINLDKRRIIVRLPHGLLDL